LKEKGEFRPKDYPILGSGDRRFGQDFRVTIKLSWRLNPGRW